MATQSLLQVCHSDGLEADFNVSENRPEEESVDETYHKNILTKNFKAILMQLLGQTLVRGSQLICSKRMRKLLKL